MYKIINVTATNKIVDIPKGYKVVSMVYRNYQSETCYILIKKKFLGLF